MRYAARLTFCVPLLLLLHCATTGRGPAVQEELDRYFARLHELHLFSGAIVVSDGRGVVFAQGYGHANLEQQVLFTPDTSADGGSIAKTFTSMLLLMLQHEAKLDLGQPAQRLLPELPYPDVTLQHLLSHSSGIPVRDYDYFDESVPPGQVRTTARLLEVIAREKPPLLFTPGTKFEYSSFGFDLAALAAERATGRAYGDLLVERFFKPLGMTATFLRPARLADFPQPRTIGYQRDGESKVHDVFDYEGFHGGSNIYFSARDLDRWSRAFLREVFDPVVVRDALRPAVVGGAHSQLSLGSWYRSADRSAVWYPGHLQGFHDVAYRDHRTGRSIAYVSNNTIGPWMQHQIIRAVNAILDGRRAEDPVDPALSDVKREQRELLVGRWQMQHSETFDIVKSATHISLRIEGVDYRMVQIGPSAFYVPGVDYVIGFAGDGSLTKIFVSSNIDARWGRRIDN